MTRKDWERIERILKACKITTDKDTPIPEYPSMEWMRRRIALEFIYAFALSGEAETKFMHAAGLPVEQERTFK